MIKTREQLEQEELQILAPCAQKSAESAGRQWSEPPHPFRSHYQRDRARIIHSKAFRRLEFKTQVFLTGGGDHLRNRLTHTIEVANISRSIACSLSLNQDLTETIALAHDLGHSPFGHSGEETLNELMDGHGGFEHNLQSLRVVEQLEQRYPGFPGLNLTREVLEGLRKHDKFYTAPATGAANPCPSLEAQIANLADEITYYSHDLDDGLYLDLVDPAALDDLDIWRETKAAVLQSHPGLGGKQLHIQVLRSLIDREVEDVVATTHAAVRAAGVHSAGDVRRHPRPLVRYSDAIHSANREMRRFLYEKIYYHPRVAGVNRNACKLLADVFTAYINKPEMLSDSATARIESGGLHRAVCDYVAGMTDRYLIEEHQRIFKSDAGTRLLPV